jgi:hypothetical protein
MMTTTAAGRRCVTRCFAGRDSSLAQRRDANDSNDNDMTFSTTNATTNGGTVPTTNHQHGQWLRVVDVVLDKCLDDNDCGDGDGDDLEDGYDEMKGIRI